VVIYLLIWGVLWWSADKLFFWGLNPKHGLGLVVLVLLLLALGALLPAQRPRRSHLFHTLQFAVPAYTLVAMLTLLPNTCYFCDQSPGTWALELVEFWGEFLYCNAAVTISALSLLLAFRPNARPLAEKTAHFRATRALLLATVLATTWAYGSYLLFEPQLVGRVTQR